MRTFAGLLCALLVLAECAGAAGPQLFMIASHRVAWTTACGEGELVEAQAPFNLHVQIHNAQGEVWRNAYPNVLPGDTVGVETPFLADGTYQLWTRNSKDGINSCDTLITFHVEPPPDTVVAVPPYEVRTLLVEYALFDRRTGLIVHPIDLARWMNDLWTMTRPKP